MGFAGLINSQMRAYIAACVSTIHEKNHVCKTDRKNSKLNCWFDYDPPDHMHNNHKILFGNNKKNLNLNGMVDISLFHEQIY